jgi:hypothetical protein
LTIPLCGNKLISVTAKELLEINGDFRQSPLIETIHILHGLFNRYGVDYAVIGGMAVVRSGSARTTHDVDVLTTREGWSHIRDNTPEELETSIDSARCLKTAIEIDVLFAGDEWDMVLPLPQPSDVSEYDDELGGNFISLPSLIELKCAVYMQKRREYGIELAAKDLADVVDLLRSNIDVITDLFIAKLHPKVRDELMRIRQKVRNRARRRKAP